MRQFNVKAWLVALLIALVPCVAGAVGLGRLTMLSALGERLIVEIDLVSVTKEELSTLSARLSGPTPTGRPICNTTPRSWARA